MQPEAPYCRLCAQQPTVSGSIPLCPGVPSKGPPCWILVCWFTPLRMQSFVSAQVHSHVPLRRGRKRLWAASGMLGLVACNRLLWALGTAPGFSSGKFTVFLFGPVLFGAPLEHSTAAHVIAPSVYFSIHVRKLWFNSVIKRIFIHLKVNLEFV